MPSGYIYASFLVFLYSSLLTYYYNYKQTLLIANQQQYLVVYNYHSILLLKSIVQILVVALLPHPYVWWLVLHVVFVTLATWNLERAIKRTFPYFNMYWKEGEILYKRYSHLMTKVKQVFFHHVASFALTRSSSIIIYAYTSLTLVTLYENYLLVITAVQSLSNSIFGGIYAGVGNLVAEGNKQRIMRVFKELFSIRFFLSCVCCYGVLEVMEPLICLWIGEQYLLPQKTLYLATAILYINLSRQAVEIFIAAHGMYQDIAAPIIESVLNIVLSCWFGYMWGINGVLLGVLVSLIVIVLCWKPYFLFRFGLKCSLLKYIWMYAVHFCCMLLTCIVTTYFFKLVPFSPVSDIWSLLFIGLIHIIFFSLLLGGILWIFVPEMKMFCQRIIQLLKS